MNSTSLPLYNDRPSLHLLPSCSTMCLSGSPPGSRRSSLSSGHFSSGSHHQDLDLVETSLLPPGFRDNHVEKRVWDMVQSDVFPYLSKITHTPLHHVHAPSCATMPPLPSTHHCRALSHATAAAFYYLQPHVQPVPHSVVCTALSCALCRCVPLHCRRPLHAAATLYTPPLLPSTHRRRCPLCATPAAPMCHHQPHHRPLPLHAAPPLSMAIVHAPRAAWAPLGAHCRRMHLTHVHTSHTGPRATPLRPPCLSPVPGPIHGRAPHLCPHCVRPCLPGPIHGRALHLGPHCVRPRLLGPIHSCAPRLSPCCVRPRLLGPIHGHATRSHDRVRVVFVCHWVAHMHRESMGNCSYTVDTLYEQVW